MKKMSNIFIGLIIIVDLIFMTFRVIDGEISRILICLSFIPILFIPKILRKVFKLNISFKDEICFVIFVFLADLVGSVMEVYDIVSWYDTFIHLLSGIVTAYFSLTFLNILKKYNKKNYIFNVIFIISITLSVACFWEIFEFVSDMITGGDAQKVLETGVYDTMKDMICALIGSILFSVLYVRRMLKEKV